MKVIRLIEFTGGPALIEADAPEPRPGRDELLIRISAAGVTTAELQWYPTLHNKQGQDRVGAIPCHEFSGVVEDGGQDVGSLEIGQEVFGMNDWYAGGA